MVKKGTVKKTLLTKVEITNAFVVDLQVKFSQSFIFNKQLFFILCITIPITVGGSTYVKNVNIINVYIYLRYVYRIKVVHSIMLVYY